MAATEAVAVAGTEPPSGARTRHWCFPRRTGIERLPRANDGIHQRGRKPANAGGTKKSAIARNRHYSRVASASVAWAASRQNNAPSALAATSSRSPEPLIERPGPTAVTRRGGAVSNVMHITRQPRPRTAISSVHSRRFNPLPSSATNSPASIRRTTASIDADSVTAPSR